jgi:polyhydroxyalkanoate synthesis repressor PhaR
MLDFFRMAYVIKRYSNRKLYDTQESRYVTLEELEELIRAGKEISVVDVSNGEDLTSVTLAQIILEKERHHRTALPTAFLHQLIKHGEAWQDFVQKSFRSSLDSIITSQRESDRVFREWSTRAGWAVPHAPDTDLRPKADKPVETDALKGDNLKDEVAALREQLRALEERLEKRRER